MPTSIVIPRLDRGIHTVFPPVLATDMDPVVKPRGDVEGVIIPLAARRGRRRWRG